MVSLFAKENKNEEPSAEILNPAGGSPVLLVCEHASNRIPPRYVNLGLTPESSGSHAAWDPGALPLAKQMSEFLDATLVAGTVSRLVYDCNRPPESPAAILDQSERIAIPGNIGLTESQRRERVERTYEPFRRTVAGEILRRRGTQTALVTVHSFTPVYMGKRRDVEIGIVHDTDAKLADVMLDVAEREGAFKTSRNQPYGPRDGVTHTLKLHGIENGLPNVMLEVANNLLETPEQQREVAELLCCWLIEALEANGFDLKTETDRCRA
ncbi:MAG: N-formylglutamate amidohydrolase [Rhizobiaceae bacterium]